MMEYMRSYCHTKFAPPYGSASDGKYAIFHLRLTILCSLCINPYIGVNLHRQTRKLTRVPPRLPTDFVDLDLRNNEISGIGADNFTGLSSLIEIDLSRYRIADINELPFFPCASLLTLNLGNNELTTMPTTFGPSSPNWIDLTIRVNPCVIELN